MGNTERFWLDGRFIPEYMADKTSVAELGEKFIWTDGSKMDYKNWNSESRARNCSKKMCPPGEPQQSETHLCLHGGVSSMQEPEPFQNREEATDTEVKCASWGNQVDCITKLPFVCKKVKGPRFFQVPWSA